jgi:hypothetical protein
MIILFVVDGGSEIATHSTEIGEIDLTDKKAVQQAIVDNAQFPLEMTHEVFFVPDIAKIVFGKEIEGNEEDEEG